MPIQNMIKQQKDTGCLPHTTHTKKAQTIMMQLYYYSRDRYAAIERVKKKTLTITAQHCCKLILICRNIHSTHNWQLKFCCFMTLVSVITGKKSRCIGLYIYILKCTCTLQCMWAFNSSWKYAAFPTYNNYSNSVQ